jgi:hypothetical protein
MIKHSVARSDFEARAEQRPLLLVPLTPFGKVLADSVRRRLSDGEANCPAWLTCVPDGDSHDALMAEALTEVLHVGHTMPRALPTAPDGVFRPHVWLLAAVAELNTRLPLLRAAVDSARRELRRACLPGRVLLLLYAGPVDGKLPSPDVLSAVTPELGASAVLVVTDNAESGYRLRLHDAVDAIAMQLEVLTRHPALVDRLVAVAADSPQRLVTLGMARIDVSDEAIRSCAMERLLERLATFLSRCEAVPRDVMKASATIDDEGLASLLRGSGGRLAHATEMMQRTASQMSARQRAARVKYLAERTRHAIAAEMPLTWWQWLLELVFSLLRRSQQRVSRHVRDNADSAAELARADLRALQLVHLLINSLRPGETQIVKSAWELRIDDHPDGRAVLDALLPPVEALAWQLASCPVEQLLASATDRQRFCGRLRDLCREALRGFDPRAVLTSSLAAALADRAAAVASPLVPWGAAAVERWSLSPPGMPEPWNEMLRKHTFQPLSASSGGGVLLVNIASRLAPPETAGEEDSHATL